MLNKRRCGLGALIPGAGLADAGAAQLAPVIQIAVNPYQPRRTFAPEALNELADSIRRHGILQPLTVRSRPGGFELIAGERRLQASRLVGLAEVPVIVRECSDEEMLALALVENVQREDLNAMEAAHSYRQLMVEFKLSQTEVAELVGKNRTTVSNTLRLLALPPAIQQGVHDSIISEGHARTLLAVEDEAKRNALYRTVVEKGLSVRALEELVHPAPRQTTRRKTKPPIDANLEYLQDELQCRLGMRVTFKPRANPSKGTLEIEYYSPEDLEQIYQALIKE